MEKNADAIVVGGGLGGISSALSLAAKGYKVTLYEKNPHIGGKLNTKTVDGFTFDLGPSILTMPRIFRKLFSDFKKDMEDYIHTQLIENQWRAFFPDSDIINLYADTGKMLAENKSLSKEDIKEYEDFLLYAKDLYDITEEGYFSKGLDTFRDVIRFYGPVRSIKGFDYYTDMYDAIGKYVKNKNLKDMLAYFIKYVGSSPYDAPAVLNMMIYMQKKEGLWYVPGGMHKISLGLEKLAQEEGVIIHKNKEVIKLEKSLSGEITNIVLEDGSKAYADIFVSNMEVIPANEKLLESPPSVVKKLKKFEPACSGLVLHLGVKDSYPFLSHHNFLFSKDPKKHFDTVFKKKKLPEDPTIYLVNVNKTDPGQAPEGHENLKVLPHIPYLQEEKFTREEYEALRERVLIKMEEMGFKDLRKNIVTQDMWTPEDINKWYNSDRGAIYGVVSDRKKNHGLKNKKKSNEYKNLYFVGGTVNPGGGMPMVILSGQNTADLIAKYHPITR